MSRPDKRSRALDASNGHAAMISLDEGHGLAAVAAQLAALEDTFSLMVRAGMDARDKPGGLEDWKETTPERIAASEAESLFENVNRRTHDITDTLQDLILQMEPRTLDETLSLALIYKNQMVLFLNDIYERPESIKEEMRDREPDARPRDGGHHSGAGARREGEQSAQDLHLRGRTDPVGPTAPEGIGHGGAVLRSGERRPGTYDTATEAEAEVSQP